MKSTSTVLLLCFVCGFLRANDVIDPASFARAKKGWLSDEEIRLYIIARDNLQPDRSLIMTKDGQFNDIQSSDNVLRLIKQSLLDQADSRLGEIRAHLNVTKGPYAVGDLLKAEHLKVMVDGRVVPEDNKDEIKPIPGLFVDAAKLRGGSRGPLLLRRKGSDWSTNLTDAEGAIFAWSSDKLSHETTLNSEGALIYPISFFAASSDDVSKSSRSATTLVLPSVSWNTVKVGNSRADDVEELQFQVPIAWSTNHTDLGWLLNSAIVVTPYFLTDFEFKGAVVGATLSYTPFIFERKSGFAINKGYTGLGYGPVMYRIGMVPYVEVNQLSSASQFINRDDHKNHSRLGGSVELGLRTLNYPSLELLLSYQAFVDLSGQPNHSDLLALNAKVWINDYTALSFGHEKGKTPVAEKDIDLDTAGLEVRF